MPTSVRTGWIRRVLVFGATYFTVGYGSAALDPAIADRYRFMWRLTAWIASAVVFSTHIGYEHTRHAASAGVTAQRAAMAVALGGFLLALAAATHAVLVTSHAPDARFLIALVGWPTIVGVPALVAAFAAATILGRWSTNRAARPRR